MQPNSRRAPKSYYENYWMYLVTSLYMCDGRSSTTNFVANALMTPGGRADSLWILVMGSTSAMMTPTSPSLNKSVNTSQSAWNHSAGSSIGSHFVRNSCFHSRHSNYT